MSRNYGLLGTARAVSKRFEMLLGHSTWQCPGEVATLFWRKNGSVILEFGYKLWRFQVQFGMFGSKYGEVKRFFGC